MKITENEYLKLSNEKTPNSPLLKNVIFAFLVGGFICTLGQLILEIYLNYGLSRENSAAATSVTLIFIGALLTGLRLYDKIAKFAGAGTIVPITGFSNAITSAALEFKSEGLILGLAPKMFIIAGPVLVYGISASIIYGIILVLIGV